MSRFIPSIKSYGSDKDKKTMNIKDAYRKELIFNSETDPRNVPASADIKYGDNFVYDYLSVNLRRGKRDHLSKGESGKFINSKTTNALNTSFSGVDTKLSITFNRGKPIYIGEVQTVTYSIYRPVEPVYSLGDAKPTGFVRGQRTIAGSIIFTVFDRNVMLNAFYNAYKDYQDKGCIDAEYLTDELPPFDMHLTFMNEYGVSAALVIYGCYIPSEGQVHSIEDMITESTIQYVATDMRLMRPGDIT